METERRVKERTSALVASELRYQVLAERYSTLSVLSPVGVFLASASGELTYANPRWHQITSYSPEKLLADWKSAVLPEDLQKMTDLWDQAIAAGTSSKSPFNAELRFTQGNFVQFEVSHSVCCMYQSGLTCVFL
jgi:PAS domain S-box-containing protein